MVVLRAMTWCKNYAVMLFYESEKRCAKGVPGAKTFLPYSYFVNDFKRKKLGFFPIMEAFPR